MDGFPALRVQVLGEVSAWRGGDPIALGPASRRAVLGLLALAGGQPLGRTELLAGVWNGRPPPPTAVNVLQSAADEGRDTETWQLAWTLWTYLDRRGHWHALAASQLAAVAAAGRTAGPAVQAEAYRLLARACAVRAARRVWRRSLAILGDLDPSVAQGIRTALKNTNRD